MDSIVLNFSSTMIQFSALSNPAGINNPVRTDLVSKIPKNLCYFRNFTIVLQAANRSSSRSTAATSRALKLIYKFFRGNNVDLTNPKE